MIRIGLLGASKIAPKAIIHPAQGRQDCVIQAVASRSETRARNSSDRGISLPFSSVFFEV